ncbi:hypothetical protein [Intrasporangium sp. DVR]|uniref:hypothetical protein n=1 Tax=Intrasporangium sp. DVR TaxID=3127867 RepID=UPI00313A57C4
MSTTLRVLAAAALCAAPLIGSATLASAGGGPGDTTLTNGTGSWLEIGPVPGLLDGNVHRGGVAFLDDADPQRQDFRDGRIEDWTCPDGVLPPALYAIEDPESFPGTSCTLERVLHLDLDDTTVTVGDRLSGARITGTAHVNDEAGHVVTSVPVDLAFEADGAARRQTDVFRFQDENGNWLTDRMVFTTRAAQLAGTVGTIGVGDGAGDATQGILSTQESTVR